MRRMTELMMDTGRRPDEICQLRLDCLTHDGHGEPVLIYTDSKNHRPNRRLPIAEATARIITSQQADVRARFPGTAPRDLPLFPRDRRNLRGTATYDEPAFTNTHRQWVNSIAPLLVTTATGADGKQHEQVFDRLAVIPYAYRHSYAQRHADEGISPDVLRDLLGHDKIGTTLGYYRVSEKRVRAAIDRVSGHQFDSQGRRVFLDIRGLLADEHARMRVAVPFGVCTEPSNVKAAGRPAPTSSPAWAAGTSAATRPTCPSSSPTCSSCSPTANGSRPPPNCRTGPKPSSPRARKRSPSCGS